MYNNVGPNRTYIIVNGGPYMNLITPTHQPGEVYTKNNYQEEKYATALKRNWPIQKYLCHSELLRFRPILTKTQYIICVITQAQNEHIAIDRRVSFFSKKKKNRIFDKLTQNMDYFSSKKGGIIYLICSRVLKYNNNN